LNLELDDCLSR